MNEPALPDKDHQNIQHHKKNEAEPLLRRLDLFPPETRPTVLLYREHNHSEIKILHTYAPRGPHSQGPPPP